MLGVIWKGRISLLLAVNFMRRLIRPEKPVNFLKPLTRKKKNQIPPQVSKSRRNSSTFFQTMRNCEWHCVCHQWTLKLWIWNLLSYIVALSWQRPEFYENHHFFSSSIFNGYDKSKEAWRNHYSRSFSDLLSQSFNRPCRAVALLLSRSQAFLPSCYLALKLFCSLAFSL